MFIRFLLLSVISLCVGFILYVESYYQTNKINPVYNDFLVKIKSENYLEAYKIMYSYTKNLEKEALKLISDTYLYGLGVDIDLVKYNIWKERSKCGCLDTGKDEYEKYNYYLDNKNYILASFFLVRSAEKGNVKSIYMLKDNEFIKKNKLILNNTSKKYWEEFDYDNLYPFCNEINECRSIRQ